MAVVLTRGELRREARERAGRGPTDWLGGWAPWLWGSAVFVALQIAFYIYQNTWALGAEAGIDAASAAFKKYWLTLFYAELVVVGLFTGAWWGWLIRSGRQLEGVAVTHDEEVRRIAVLWGLIGITSLILYFMASFNPNSDSSWHQTQIRDTALTPGHIAMFFFWFPMGVTFTVGSYLYGRTRIPAVYGRDKGFPWSFFLLISASVLEVIQIAFNEWGHSIWWVEEFFAAPFHWPFVLYGWLAGGMFAVWGETILRLADIEREKRSAEKERALATSG